MVRKSLWIALGATAALSVAGNVFFGLSNYNEIVGHNKTIQTNTELRQANFDLHLQNSVLEEIVALASQSRVLSQKTFVSFFNETCDHWMVQYSLGVETEHYGSVLHARDVMEGAYRLGVTCLELPDLKGEDLLNLKATLLNLEDYLSGKYDDPGLLPGPYKAPEENIEWDGKI